MKQAELGAGTRDDGMTTTEREELARLRRENRRLRGDVEILKRATAFFASQGDPVNICPFIEAEKAGSHNVRRACELLQVPRSAYYADRAADRYGRAPRQWKTTTIADPAAAQRPAWSFIPTAAASTPRPSTPTWQGI